MKKFILIKAIHVLFLLTLVVAISFIDTYWAGIIMYSCVIAIACYIMYVIVIVHSFNMALKELTSFKPVSARLTMDNLNTAYYLTRKEIVRLKPLYDGFTEGKPFFLNVELEPTYIFLANDNEFDLMREVASIDPERILEMHFYQTTKTK